MKTISLKQNWLNLFSLALILPTLIFITFSVLKYNFGITGPYDTMETYLINLGLKESIGWNINLLFICGPLLALLLSILQILEIQWQFSKEQVDIRFTVLKKWFPLSVGMFSGVVLFSLLIYLVVENL